MTRQGSLLATAAAFAGAVALHAPASAQDAPANPLAAVIACGQITDDAERLACFDREVATIESATQTGELVAVDRAAVREIERDAFGFNLPSLPRISLFRSLNTADAEPKQPTLTTQSPDTVETADAAPDDATTTQPATPAPDRSVADANEPLDRVTLTLARMSERPNGRMRFFMENGQVWVQTDTGPVRVKSRDLPTSATIRKAALGSFLMRIDGYGRAIRVSRER